MIDASSPADFVTDRRVELSPSGAKRWTSSRWLAGIVLGLVTTVLYAVTAVSRFNQLRAGVDLAIFREAAFRYAHGNMPWSMAKGAGGFNLLGDHFSPILALTGPVYRLFPDPRALLVLQSCVIGLAVALLAGIAVERCGAFLGYSLATGYALCWGVQSMALFDFHEVCFALPILILAGRALMERNGAAVYLWLLALMLVKEDGVFLAIGYALSLAALTCWRWAIATAATALAGYSLIILWIVPKLSWYGRWTYWSATGSSDHQPLVAMLKLLGESLGGPGAWLLMLLVVPTAGLCLRSPLILAVLPSLIIRLTSPNKAYWGTDFHYNATLVTIAFLAAVDGWFRWKGRPTWGQCRSLWGVAILAATALILPRFPLWHELSVLTEPCLNCADARVTLSSMRDLGNGGTTWRLSIR